MSGSISVVIPTYRRNEQLAEVLEHLLASDVKEIDDVEVIVVDDGSPLPAEEVVREIGFTEPFRIRYVWQENSGPAAARNFGFRNAVNEVVLFLDDDVLAPAGLLFGHLQAHRERPGSVVFGLYPYVKPEKETPSYRYLDMLEREAREGVGSLGPGPYVPANIVASGNLSVEKSTFAGDGAVYDESLRTPMAEEIELATRLAANGISILYVSKLNALHTQPTTIKGKCVQDYKYGLGIAEAYARLRAKVPPEQFYHTMRVNGPITRRDPMGLKLSKMVKSLLAARPVRKTFLSGIHLAEKVFSNNDRILFWLYRKLVGVHYFAGIREGLQRFR